MSPPAPRPWWQTGVVYHVYPRAFADGDGDGTGDLAGLAERLDHIAWLGADAVWISPFYPSPGADGGYDVADYTGVDPAMGTLETFARVVDRARALGLRVILDWVPNHSSDRHPWFAESRASGQSPRRDWYVWRDPAPGEGPPHTRPPTNWLSAFGGPAWTFDAPTGQFYLHSFLPEQPDLNWRCPALVAAMHDTLRVWMDRGADGFRVDVAHHILKDPAFRDNPPEPHPHAGHKPVSDYDRQRHVYDRAHPDVHAAFRDLRALVDAHLAPGGGPPPERALFGEIHLAHDLPAWASYFGTPEALELHQPLHFGLLSAPFTAAGLRAHITAVERAVPAHGWPSYVLGSHDERRLASRLAEATGAPADRAVRLAHLLLLTLRGTPTLYQGDEIGTPDGVVPPERVRDPAGLRTGVPGLGRDAGRTPLAWDGSPSGGFSAAPPERLWLPLHPGHERVNVTAQRADPASLLHVVRRLLALRRAVPALHAGSLELLATDDPHVLRYARQGADGSLARVALNLSGTPQPLGLPPLEPPGAAPSDLPPWGGALLVSPSDRSAADVLQTVPPSP